MRVSDVKVYGISGGPIENFREGWAILPFVGSHAKPHFWRRIELSNRYLALCGLRGSLATLDDLVGRGMPHARGIRPLAPGDFAANRCSSCSLSHSRRECRRHPRRT